MDMALAMAAAIAGEEGDGAADLVVTRREVATARRALSAAKRRMVGETQRPRCASSNAEIATALAAGDGCRVQDAGGPRLLSFLNLFQLWAFPILLLRSFPPTVRSSTPCHSPPEWTADAGGPRRGPPAEDLFSQARAPFKAHGYPFSDVKFNVTKGKYSKLHKGILAIATRVPSTEIYEHNVTQEEHSKLLEDILATAKRVPSTELDKHKVLPWQTGPQNQPPGWILIDLAVRDNVTTIALRIDNLYLVGFTDRNGHWYTFDGYELLIPGSTKIGFPGSYAGLGYKGRGGRHKLRELLLNRTTVSIAVQNLLDYDPSSPDKEDLQQALATLVLVICEAARFRNISADVSSGWKSVSYISRDDVSSGWNSVSYISRADVSSGWNGVGYISRDDILMEWAQLSSELLRGWDYRRKKVEKLEKKLRFEGKEEAYLLLHVLILPTEKDRRKKKGDGRKKN